MFLTIFPDSEVCLGSFIDYIYTMDSSFKTRLKEQICCGLPGRLAHEKMLPPGRRLRKLEHERAFIKQSSVLLLLYPENGRLFTCLMTRPSSMKHHPGQISFPGGKVEEDDVSVEMTALREAQEEVGIDPLKIEILGRLSELYVEVSQFAIQPVVAWADQKPDFVVNAGEVDNLILFPLSEFVTNEIIQEIELETVTGMLRVKYYPFENQIIWGATAMILSELIEILKKL